MSQYPGAFGETYLDPAAQQPKKSGLAVTALVFSLIICCPITTLLAPVLGVIAIISIGSNPMRTGKGMAMAAIIIGVIVTAAQLVVILWLVDMGQKFMTVVKEGPKNALTAGFAGDPAGFKAEFHGAAASAPDAEVEAFIEQLRTQYGAFVSATLDESADATPPVWGQAAMTLPYQITFEQGTVSADVEIVIVDQQTGQRVFKLGRIKVHGDGGDITYPPITTTPRTGTGTSAGDQPDASGLDDTGGTSSDDGG